MIPLSHNSAILARSRLETLFRKSLISRFPTICSFGFSRFLCLLAANFPVPVFRGCTLRLFRRSGHSTHVSPFLPSPELSTRSCATSSIPITPHSAFRTPTWTVSGCSAIFRHHFLHQAAFSLICVRLRNPQRTFFHFPLPAFHFQVKLLFFEDAES